MPTSISFIIPVFNEQESASQLTSEIVQAVEQLNKSYEIIFVDDGSTDATLATLKKIHIQHPNVKVIVLRRNFGKAAALSAGFNLAQGEIVFTMDGDLQDDPRHIPEFISKLEQGYDLVSGWKQKRRDTLTKTLPSLLFNFITSVFTGIKLHDFNCGFKCYKKEVIKSVNIYGQLHRFIPVLAAQKGFTSGEIIVSHRPRKYGKSKYGWGRMIVGMLDFLTVLFLTSYINRPGQFFGRVGFVVFTVGFSIGLYITYLRLTTGTIDYRYPLLFLGGLLMLGGIQLVLTGLLAEVMVNVSRKPDDSYGIKETIS